MSLGRQLMEGCPATVTLPGLLGCLYWRWLPACFTTRHPSDSTSLITSRTFIAVLLSGICRQQLIAGGFPLGESPAHLVVSIEFPEFLPGFWPPAGAAHSADVEFSRFKVTHGVPQLIVPAKLARSELVALLEQLRAQIAGLSA